MHLLTSAKFNNSHTDNVHSLQAKLQAAVYDMLPWRKVLESGAWSMLFKTVFLFKCLQQTLHKLTILFASNKFSNTVDLNLFLFYTYCIQIQNNDPMKSLQARQQASMLICIVLIYIPAKSEKQTLTAHEPSKTNPNYIKTSTTKHPYTCISSICYLVFVHMITQR